MRIAYDASRANREQRSGIENYSLEMLLALAACDKLNAYDVYLDAEPIPELQDLPSNYTLRVIRPPQWRIWLNKVLRFPLFWTEWTLAAALRITPPDVLFVPGYIVPKRYSGKAISVVHDLGFLSAPEVYTRSEKRQQIRALKRNLNQSDHLVVVSKTTGEELKTRFPAFSKPYRVIYPGVDHQTYTPMPLSVRQPMLNALEVEPPYLLYVGNILPKKGLDILIKALAILTMQKVTSEISTAEQELVEGTVADRYAALALRSAGLPSPLRLIVVGRGDPAYQAELERLAETLHVGAVTRFLGYLPTDQVVALMSGALAYIQPSRYEGFGLPVVEAMACGTPVMVSDRGALPEIVAYPEAVFPADDSAGLAERISVLLQKPELYVQLSADSQLRAHRFRWERAAKDLLDLFQQFAPAVAEPEADFVDTAAIAKNESTQPVSS